MTKVHWLDHMLSWVVCLVPRRVCRWLWYRSEDTGKPLGRWAPHIFGKMVGATKWSVRYIDELPPDPHVEITEGDDD